MLAARARRAAAEVARGGAPKLGGSLLVWVGARSQPRVREGSLPTSGCSCPLSGVGVVCVMLRLCACLSCGAEFKCNMDMLVRAPVNYT